MNLIKAMDVEVRTGNESVCLMYHSIPVYFDMIPHHYLKLVNMQPVS